METRAYLYRWTEVSTGKIYVGSRTKKGCHPDDGYICSSKVVKPMILSNPENWKREILCIGDPIYIRDLESKYLVSVDAAKNEQYYNQHNSDGKFSMAGRPQTQVQKDAVSKANKGKPKTPGELKGCRKGGLTNKGRKATPAQIEAARKNGLASKGRKATPAQIEASRKLGLANKGRPTSQAQKAAVSLAHKGTVTAFNLTTLKTEQVSKEEFDANKGILYVGVNSKLATQNKQG